MSVFKVLKSMRHVKEQVKMTDALKTASPERLPEVRAAYIKFFSEVSPVLWLKGDPTLEQCQEAASRMADHQLYNTVPASYLRYAGIARPELAANDAECNARVTALWEQGCAAAVEASMLAGPAKAQATLDAATAYATVKVMGDTHASTPIDTPVAGYEDLDGRVATILARWKNGGRFKQLDLQDFLQTAVIQHKARTAGAVQLHPQSNPFQTPASKDRQGPSM